jgi:hypothetical protein
LSDDLVRFISAAPLAEADEMVDSRYYRLWRYEHGVPEGPSEIPKGEGQLWMFAENIVLHMGAWRRRRLSPSFRVAENIFWRSVLDEKKSEVPFAVSFRC